MEDKSTNSGGIGFCGLLTGLFIGLKLTNYIDWSWWWVLAPLWGGLTLFMAVIIIIAILSAILE